MRHHPSRWLIAPALALLAACTSCQTTPPGTPAPPPTTPPQPTTPPTPPVLTSSASFDGEKHQIYQALQLFLHAYNDFLLDPGGKFKPLQDLVTPDYYNVILGERDELFELGWKGHGPRRYLNIQIADPTTQDGQRTTEATYCADLSQFNIVNVNTDEAVHNPLKTDFKLFRITLTHVPDSAWKVSGRLSKKVDTCSES